MATVIFSGFQNINKVKLDKGFKAIFNMGLKEAKDLTDQLLDSKKLTFQNMTQHQVSLLIALSDEANTKVEVIV